MQAFTYTAALLGIARRSLWGFDESYSTYLLATWGWLFLLLFFASRRTISGIDKTTLLLWAWGVFFGVGKGLIIDPLEHEPLLYVEC